MVERAVGDRPQRGVELEALERIHDGLGLGAAGLLDRRGDRQDGVLADQRAEARVVVVLRLIGLHEGIVLRRRSEEHTSELQSIMRNSYAVFCLKKNTNNNK